MEFLFGTARNERLEREIKTELMPAGLESIWIGEAARLFKNLTYTTLYSWTRDRRVIGSAEVTGGDASRSACSICLPIVLRPARCAPTTCCSAHYGASGLLIPRQPAVQPSQIAESRCPRRTSRSPASAYPWQRRVRPSLIAIAPAVARHEPDTAQSTGQSPMEAAWCPPITVSDVGTAPLTDHACAQPYRIFSSTSSHPRPVRSTLPSGRAGTALTDIRAARNGDANSTTCRHGPEVVKRLIQLGLAAMAPNSTSVSAAPQEPCSGERRRVSEVYSRRQRFALERQFWARFTRGSL